MVIKTQWLKVNDKDTNLGSSQDLDAGDSDSGGSDDEKPAKKAVEVDDLIDEDEGSVELSVRLSGKPTFIIVLTMFCFDRIFLMRMMNPRMGFRKRLTFWSMNVMRGVKLFAVVKCRW